MNKMNAYDLTELVQLQREELNKRADRIAELEKQVKHWTTPCQPLCKPSVCDCITPQTKPLSDEEINEIYWKLYEDEDIDTLEFARAIEAKVRGEK
jgi:hypothetical protein